MRALHTKRILRPLGAAGLAALLLGALTLTSAGGQNVWSRLRSNKQQTQTVQNKLKGLKAQQATRRNELSKAQVEARSAKSAYSSAKGRLESTREKLRTARKRHDECVARLKTHDKSVSQRVTIMYEMGEPSYAEVLLDATTFSDFVERADYMQRVAQQDANLLVRYTSERREAEGLRNELEVAQAEEERRARECNARKAEAEAKAAKAEALLRKANTDRASAERQLAELERNSKQLEQLLASVQRGGSSSHLRYTGKWSGFGSAPIKAGYRFTSGYGMRTHPITGRRKMHTGVDLACGSGTRIYSAAAGRVVHSGWYGAYGIAVVIDHGNGWSTLYGHCSRTAVSAGQNVSSGQVVGYVGSTGYSTGAHLHFEVRRYGRHQNPNVARY